MRRVPPIIGAVVAVALALETPTGGVDKALEGMARRDDGGCIPLNFTIRDIFLWESEDGARFTFGFGFSDDLTGVQTSCKLTESSRAAGPCDDAPRFECENPKVQFIKAAYDLTLVEQTCPNAPKPSGLEAGGSLTLDLSSCEEFTPASGGPGTLCLEFFAVGNFTSVHPTPPDIYVPD